MKIIYKIKINKKSKLKNNKKKYKIKKKMIIKYLKTKILFNFFH